MEHKLISGREEMEKALQQERELNNARVDIEQRKKDEE